MSTGKKKAGCVMGQRSRGEASQEIVCYKTSDKIVGWNWSIGQIAKNSYMVLCTEELSSTCGFPGREKLQELCMTKGMGWSNRAVQKICVVQ